MDAGRPVANKAFQLPLTLWHQTSPELRNPFERWVGSFAIWALFGVISIFFFGLGWDPNPRSRDTWLLVIGFVIAASGVPLAVWYWRRKNHPCWTISPTGLTGHDAIGDYPKNEHGKVFIPWSSITRIEPRSLNTTQKIFAVVPFGDTKRVPLKYLWIFLQNQVAPLAMDVEDLNVPASDIYQLLLVCRASFSAAPAPVPLDSGPRTPASNGKADRPTTPIEIRYGLSTGLHFLGGGIFSLLLSVMVFFFAWETAHASTPNLGPWLLTPLGLFFDYLAFRLFYHGGRIVIIRSPQWILDAETLQFRPESIWLKWREIQRIEFSSQNNVGQIVIHASPAYSRPIVLDVSDFDRSPNAIYFLLNSYLAPSIGNLK